MKIAVIASHRTQSRASGLNNSLRDLANGLAARGHDVTLVHRITDLPTADVVLDGSHDHELSRQFPQAVVVNRIGDRECPYMPPRAIVATDYMRQHYPAARLIRTGIRVDAIPFNAAGGEYLAHLALRVAHKGYDVALDVARRAGRDLVAHGEGHERGPVIGADKWAFLGGAWALVHPTHGCASDRAPLEAAATGTPTLTLDTDGSQEHVEHAVSGFICEDVDELVDAVDDVRYLDRARVREWVADAHPFDRMVDAYEAALQAALDGETW